MRRLLIILVFGCCAGSATAQSAHPILRSINIFQHDNIVVLRWVIRGGNTCQGIKVYRGQSEAAINLISEIPGICGSTDSDEAYEYVDSNAVANVFNHYRLEFGSQGLSDPVGLFFKQFGDDDVLVLPDPINDRARILFDNVDHRSAVIRVFDRNGRVLSESTTNAEEFTIQMSGWKDGLYYFQVLVNRERKSGKLFKF